jgi:hypothetical protein
MPDDTEILPHPDKLADCCTVAASTEGIYTPPDTETELAEIEITLQRRNTQRSSLHRIARSPRNEHHVATRAPNFGKEIGRVRRQGGGGVVKPPAQR